MVIVFWMTFMEGLLPQNMGVAEGDAAGEPDFGWVSRCRAFRALSRAELSTSTNLLLSHGLTMKSKAPRFMPSTANWISA